MIDTPMQPLAADLVLDPTGSCGTHGQMSGAELDLMVSALRQARVYLEYGMGDSTLLAAREGVHRIICTESDPQWIRSLLQHEHLAELMRAGRLLICKADLGELGEWGWPRTHSHVHNWPSYSAAVWGHVDAPVDLVLVDGRFRVACILATILFAGAGQRLIVHDFWNRPAYHVVLPYLEELASAESMGLFRVKPDVPVRQVFGLYARYANALI